MNSLIGFWDYTIIVITLLISTGIGFYYKFTGGKQKTVREYLFANKSMSSIPTALSLTASYVSGSALLGIPVEVFKYGIVYIGTAFSYPVAMALISHYVLPIFFKHNVSTPYEYLYKRFGYTSQLLVSSMFSIQMILYMGVSLYAPSLALEALIGIDEMSAVFIIGGTCIFYSIIGGMKAVIISDVFQTFMMFFAILTVIISGTIEAGGVQPFWDIANKGGRLNVLDFDYDPTIIYTTFSCITSGFLLFMSMYATGQAQVQRYLSVKDLKAARKSLWISTPFSILFIVLSGICGIAVFIKYHDCDPVASGKIRDYDQLIPLYISDVLKSIPGLAGLTIAGIFSGTLSSLSSVVNSLAGTTITDYINPFLKNCWKKELDDRKVTILVKVLVLFYGITCLLAAIMAKYFGGVVKGVLQIFGAIGGPILGIFVLGMFTKTSNEIGALAGYIAGNIFTFWMTFGGPKPPRTHFPVSNTGCINDNSTTLLSSPELPVGIKFEPSDYFYFYRISFMYTGLVGIVCTITIGYVLSLLSSWLYEIFNSKIRKTNRAENSNKLLNGS